MANKQIDKVADGVVLLPITAGELVLAYNLPVGPTGLKLPRDVYPDIFLGKITKWNDQRIIAANPGLTLPDLQITVVHRSDASGATFMLTKHLSAISEAFSRAIGSGMTVQWPAGENMLGAPLSDGVTAIIRQIPGAFGYIEYGYAKLTKTDWALLQNKAGNYVAPSAKSGTAALATAVLDPELRGWVEDPTGADAYPIATFAWLLAYKRQDPQKAAWMRKLVDYCVTTGQSIADSVGYIPLPENIVAKIKAASAQIQ
jgi:phosphate transport system substrate-binding protein